MNNREITIAISMAIMGILTVFNVVSLTLVGSPWHWILTLFWSIVYYFYYKKVVELWRKL